MAETIQDIIERIRNARDRCQNAEDHQGIMDANQAILDLQSLRPTALQSAREIEAYFNQRIAGRAKLQPPRAAASTVTSADDGWSDDS